jgi:transposase-like protein
MDTSQTGPQDVAVAAGRSWRRHSAEFKARVIELARQPGTSVAAVALANGLNANMLRRWVHEAAASSGASKATATSVSPTLASFVQLPLRTPEPHAVLDAQPAPPAVQQPAEITVEIHRDSTTVHAKLPMDKRSAAWLREVLG